MADLEGTLSAENSLSGKLGTVYAKDGLSAYEIAVKNGFDGTEEEWLASLKGKDAVIDQKYSPMSTNAQSGIAVAEAVSGKMDKFGTVDDYDGSVTLFGRTIYSNGKKAFLTLDDVGVALKSNGVLILNAGTQIEGNNKPLKKISTPDGTDPSQAVNVQYVAQHTLKERRMKLIADHTVTAEEASEAQAWDVSMSEYNNGTPLDKVHIVYDIPNSTTLTSGTAISARINGGTDVGSYLNYVSLNKNAYGPFWVEAEKIAENKWRNVRTQISPYINNSPLYANYFLDSVDVINSIKIFGIAFEGINIKVWGRDAI